MVNINTPRQGETIADLHRTLDASSNLDFLNDTSGAEETDPDTINMNLNIAVIQKRGRELEAQREEFHRGINKEIQECNQVIGNNAKKSEVAHQEMLKMAKRIFVPLTFVSPEEPESVPVKVPVINSNPAPEIQTTPKVETPSSLTALNSVNAMMQKVSATAAAVLASIGITSQ